MTKIILLRHGESVWNLENRFTGWTDVDLSERGLKEAHESRENPAGRRLCVRRGLHVRAQTSHPHFVDRHEDEMDLMWVPVERCWRLNERHYGACAGLQ